LTPLLRVSDLHAGYSSSRVLRGIDFAVDHGTVACVMGRNGAGKTTLLRALMGVIDKRGRVELNGTDITRWSSHRINRAGMAWVPQEGSIFAGLTVREHLTIALRNHQLSAGLETAAALFPALGDRWEQEAQTLSGGERKMLGMAQALAGGPQIVLMDEPTEGVAPVVVDQLIPAIRLIAERTAVVLVEQNIDTALLLGGHGVVMERGQIVESGDLNELHDAGVLEERLAL
jgi:branched-chain amino acid transport system ATP-binding protein